MTKQCKTITLPFLCQFFKFFLQLKTTFIIGLVFYIPITDSSAKIPPELYIPFHDVQVHQVIFILFTDSNIPWWIPLLLQMNSCFLEMLCSHCSWISPCLFWGFPSSSCAGSSCFLDPTFLFLVLLLALWTTFSNNFWQRHILSTFYEHRYL